MNLLDLVIASFAPQYAMRRLVARAAINRISAYSTGPARERSRNAMMYNSPNSTVGCGGNLPARRAAARKLMAENCLAGAIVDRVVSNAVGSGINPRLRGKPSERLKRIWGDDWWTFHLGADISGQRTFGGLQALVLRTVMVSGGCLVHMRPQTPSDTVPPLQITVHEPDHIVLDATDLQPTAGPRTIQGVSYDAAGRVAGYRITPLHPADGYSDPIFVRHGDWIYITATDRPGQVHGVPWFSRAEQNLRDHAETDEARIIAEKAHACIAGFITQGIDGTAAALGSLTQESGQTIDSIVPGTMTQLSAGQDVRFVTPPAADAAREAITILRLHEIAAGVGVPYSMMTGDLRQANYSSLRIGQIDFHHQLDIWQEWLIQQLCRPVYAAWTRAVTLSGWRQDVYDPECIWDVPERPLLDAEKEGAAIDAAIASGRMSWDEAISRRGLDPDEQVAEIAARASVLQSSNLTLAGVPGALPVGPPPNAQ